MSPYHASKFGLEGVADSLRREVKPWGINVVVIEPGSIATAIWEQGHRGVRRPRPSSPPEAKRLYGKQMDAMRDVIRHRRARDRARKVGKVIAQGDRLRQPETRYLVGTDAKLMYRMQGLSATRTRLADAPLDEAAGRRAPSALKPAS